MSQLGYIPGQKKKKNKDLTIGQFLKNKLKKFGKGLTKKPNSHMSRLGALPGQETDTPYKSLANKFDNKSVKNVKKKRVKKLTPVQKRFKEREAKGLSGLTGGKKGETITEYRTRQKTKIQDAAKKRNTEFKKTGKSTIEQRRAAAKKRMQEAARKRNADFQAARKLKIKEKKKKK